jgi:hypothetical protein
MPDDARGAGERAGGGRRRGRTMMEPIEPTPIALGVEAKSA